VTVYRSSGFLFDLASILRRYPSKEWSKLADMIDNDAGRLRITSLLRKIAELDGALRSKKSNAPAKVRVRSVTRVRDENLERLELEFSRSSVSQLRDLARRNGIAFSPKDSKKRLIGRLRNLNDHVRKPERRASLTREISIRRQDPEDYEKWADIILGRTKP
jgi:hypothetical protein